MGRVGFEPTKAKPADLQSAAFDQTSLPARFLRHCIIGKSQKKAPPVRPRTSEFQSVSKGGVWGCSSACGALAVPWHAHLGLKNYEPLWNYESVESVSNALLEGSVETGILPPHRKFHIAL